MNVPSPEPTTALCIACGLCCDGSLFQRVDITPGERRAARRHQLRVIDQGRAIAQPCAGLDARHGCRLYGERPERCARFVCQLHERVRRGETSLDDAVAAVSRVRALAALLIDSGLTPDALTGDGVDPALRAADDELSRLLVVEFARASA